MKNKKLAVLALLPVFALTACGETGATAEEAHNFVAKSATVDVAKIIKNTHAVVDLNGLSAKGTIYTGEKLGFLPVEINAGSQKVFDVTLKNYNGVLSNIQNRSLMETEESGGGVLSALNEISSIFFEKWFTVDVFDFVTGVVAIVNGVAGSTVINESYSIAGEESLTVRYEVPDLEALGKVVKKLYEEKVIDFGYLPVMGKGSASLEYTYGANGYLKGFSGAFNSDDIKIYDYYDGEAETNATYAGTLHGNLSMTSDILFYQDDEIAKVTFTEQLLDSKGDVKTNRIIPATEYTARGYTKEELTLFWDLLHPFGPKLENTEGLELLGSYCFDRVLPGLGSYFVIDIPSSLTTEFVQDYFYIIPSSGVAHKVELKDLYGTCLTTWETKDDKGNVIAHIGFFMSEGVLETYVKGDFELKFVFAETK